MAVTDVSAPLPQLDLAPLTTITVTFDDPATVITRLNVYGYTPDRGQDVEPAPFVPLFAYGPSP